MLKTIALVIGIAVAALLLFAATRPDSFSMERSTSIAASPDKVFALINDLKGFNTWNPWALKDPTTKLTYEGSSTAGVGAAYTWQGSATGAGRMEIIESAAPQKVVARLEFKEPMTATNRVEFTLAPQAGATTVTWAMSGPMPFMSKLMSVFMSFDKMVGPDFEAGLANLKKLAEKP
ncbi:MAG: SRPBCC family protein [Burkholderiales bacterium]